MATRPTSKVDLTQDEIDNMRRGFAHRMREVIQNSPGEQKLEEFSEKSGIAMRQLSQWQNPRHLNWPSIANLARIARAAGVSLDWLIFGDRSARSVAAASRRLSHNERH